MTVDHPSKRRYWLLTMPRTASNMLIRVLNLDEQGVRPSRNGGYFFFPSMMARLGLYSKPSQDWTLEDHATVREGLSNSFNSLQDYLEAAEGEGQKMFVKEHISFLNSVYYEQKHMFGGAEDSLLETTPARDFTSSTRSSLNLTSLPDEFLKTWFPTFLIRHPALMIPSLYRTARCGIELDGKGRSKNEPYKVEATLKFVRALFDFYLNHFGKDSEWPVVLDADDIIAHPELVMKYAELVGLDPGKLRFSWEKASQEQLDKLLSAEKIMLGSFNASTGVDKGKIAGNIDLNTEAEKWRNEFGEEGGRKMERWVRDAMPDYEYLRSRRLMMG
ncbi:hypothetical protein NUW58_g2379 [Xylaria curta]|uniref:Uncharacterized protein n=1 Tax=Xylaria curta TaxID=42375 RepID=A0ACC1PID2_9PEZI|nr:hypothetical protein NUW58_g2379 [Xylaria curta]